MILSPSLRVMILSKYSITFCAVNGVHSNVAERLGLDLEVVVDICNELEDKGIIGMLEQ